jgi:CRISPR-associated protein Cas2
VIVRILLLLCIGRYYRLVYVILVYDVAVDRVNKVLKICRMYLTWVQNSVFEGELVDADLIRLKRKLSDVIDESVDSVTFYIISRKYDDKIVLGRVKGEPTVVL